MLPESLAGPLQTYLPYRWILFNGNSRLCKVLMYLPDALERKDIHTIIFTYVLNRSGWGISKIRWIGKISAAKAQKIRDIFFIFAGLILVGLIVNSASAHRASSVVVATPITFRMIGYSG